MATARRGKKEAMQASEKTTQARPPGTKPLFVNAPEELMAQLDEMLEERRKDPMRRRDTRTDLVLEVLFKAVQDWQRKRAKDSGE